MHFRFLSRKLSLLAKIPASRLSISPRSVYFPFDSGRQRVNFLYKRLASSPLLRAASNSLTGTACR